MEEVHKTGHNSHIDASSSPLKQQQLSSSIDPSSSMPSYNASGNNNSMSYSSTSSPGGKIASGVGVRASVSSSAGGGAHAAHLRQSIESGSNGYDDDVEMYSPNTNQEQAQSLQELLGRVRRLYGNAVMTGNRDRIGFESAIGDLESYCLDLETTFNSKIESLRADLIISRRDKELRMREWTERYGKLQSRWNEMTQQHAKVQEDLEDLRQQRDMLLMTHKTKSIMHHQSSSSDLKPMQYNFVKQLAEGLLLAITQTLSADRASVFIYHAPSKELRSLCLVSSSDDKMPKEIRLNCRKGIAGRSFTSGEAVNIANAYQDNRFYKSIDAETGYITNSVLCYPLYSPRTDTTIGVLQLINKKNDQACFSVEDEARMTEYSFLISALLDQTKELFQFGMGGVPMHGQIDSRMGSPSGEGYSETASAHHALKRKASHVNVKRIGHTTDTSREGRFAKPASLVPKDIEDYINKLEQCWRNAVKDCALLQNTKAQLESEKSNSQTRIFALEKNVQELEDKLKSYKDKSVRVSKEQKQQQVDSVNREQQLRNEIKEYQKLKDELDRQKHENESNNIANTLVPPNAAPTSAIQGRISSISNATAAAGPNSTSHWAAPVDKSLSVPPMAPQVSKSPARAEEPLKLPQIDENKHKFSLEMDSVHGVKHASALEDSFFTPRGMDILTQRNHRQNGNHRELYAEVFSCFPAPIIILTNQYRVWRVNSKLCDLLDSDEEDLLGLMFSEICLLDQDTLPRLLEFDVVQGLGIHPPKKGASANNTSSKSVAGAGNTTRPEAISSENGHVVYKVQTKSFLKVNVQISVIGDAGLKFASSKNGRVVKAPLYALVFNRVTSR